jgi:hypothetical protein
MSNRFPVERIKEFKDLGDGNFQMSVTLPASSEVAANWEQIQAEDIVKLDVQLTRDDTLYFSPSDPSQDDGVRSDLDRLRGAVYDHYHEQIREAVILERRQQLNRKWADNVVETFLPARQASNFLESVDGGFVVHSHGGKVHFDSEKPLVLFVDRTPQGSYYRFREEGDNGPSIAIESQMRNDVPLRILFGKAGDFFGPASQANFLDGTGIDLSFSKGANNWQLLHVDGHAVSDDAYINGSYCGAKPMYAPEFMRGNRPAQIDISKDDDALPFVLTPKQLRSVMDAIRMHEPAEPEPEFEPIPSPPGYQPPTPSIGNGERDLVLEGLEALLEEEDEPKKPEQRKGPCFTKCPPSGSPDVGGISID